MPSGGVEVEMGTGEHSARESRCAARVGGRKCTPRGERLPTKRAITLAAKYVHGRRQDGTSAEASTNSRTRSGTECFSHREIRSDGCDGDGKERVSSADVGVLEERLGCETEPLQTANECLYITREVTRSRGVRSEGEPWRGREANEEANVAGRMDSGAPGCKRGMVMRLAML